jgi:hypothetical protein
MKSNASLCHRTICEECKEHIYTCDKCSNYFKDGDKIHCVDGGDFHYCEDCGEL